MGILLGSYVGSIAEISRSPSNEKKKSFFLTYDTFSV